MRSPDWVNRLSRSAEEGTHCVLWKSIRHHIGRLGSWIKASKVVVDYYRRNPPVALNFEFQQLSNPQRSKIPSLLQETDLKGVLKDTIPEYDIDHVERKLRDLPGYRSKSVEDLFVRRIALSKARFRIHAELTLLEHFLSRGFEFWGPSKYIGCSKGSCYCCSLYMMYRSGNEISRFCHGNAWHQWAFPNISGISEFSKEQSFLLKHMSKSVRDDLRLRLLHGNTWCERRPDSTTGISSFDVKLITATSLSSRSLVGV